MIVSFLSSLTYAVSSFFFFNDTATTEIYTLSLHDALPIWSRDELIGEVVVRAAEPLLEEARRDARGAGPQARSEEHTSELQSPCNLVCRLLLEKKKQESVTLMLCVRPRESV